MNRLENQMVVSYHLGSFSENLRRSNVCSFFSLFSRFGYNLLRLVLKLYSPFSARPYNCPPCLPPSPRPPSPPTPPTQLFTTIVSRFFLLLIQSPQEKSTTKIMAHLCTFRAGGGGGGGGGGVNFMLLVKLSIVLYLCTRFPPHGGWFV